MSSIYQVYQKSSDLTQITGKLCNNRDRKLKLKNPDMSGYSSNASCPLNCITITESIPLLVDYEPLSVSSAQSVLISLSRYLCWWTISSQGYHPSSSQCFETYMVY